ncbi:molybdenum ABC transporter ATP-binding protein [Azotobacter beijerinckii]|uniref:Molybdate transport system ATP-binding protein n=1 Tax=Azotobacter beijerinckii TaxID=170623 RepID=A0A1I4AZE9_9GAMM|nr:molybdenum ABC transporter ATP-binding protein [Azotobacter beijerinckii]SFB03463.1 molybdate transport system ATP-binding protein [Azotobacter beijerinckii]SFK62012.1 molybdate transport system ATP-binding protein [Azotobacter beijerinckii]
MSTTFELSAADSGAAARSAGVSADGIRARFRLTYPGFALDVDLTLPGHGVTALFGHSGSGKTTILRCVAGLERAAEARLEINGELWQDSAAGVFLPTHKRALGYVFQEASLFPHLSVRRNLEYGMKRVDAAGRRVSWERVLELLGIGHLLDRLPGRLSGGERQRVGIARALLTSPRLLLLDEPLAALDLKRKNEILPYLERLHDELDIPMLLVSHSPDEVARLADHVVLLDQGRVAAQGDLQETLARLDLPTAFSEDAGVVVESRVAEHDDRYHLTRLEFPGGAVLVARRPEALGQRLRLRVHARDVSLALHRIEDTSITNVLPATVREVVEADTPAHVLVRLDAEGTPLIARITRRSCDQLEVLPGKRMWAQIKAVALLA